MTFLEARNVIVAELEKHIGCPVILSDQIADVPEYPYCYYSVLTPRTTDHSFGLNEVRNEKVGYTLLRSEPVSATMSFTFCSMNRETEDGYIFGEDEAMTLADKAHGFFLLDAHNIHTANGDIVINNVGAAVSRTSFLVEDSLRRYGFGIKFSYIRTDEKVTTTILKPGNPVGFIYQ